MGYLYILGSGQGKYYVGSTINIENRLYQHRSGKVLSTKGLGVLKLLYLHECTTIQEARKIEYQIKQQKSRIIIEKIIHGEINIYGLLA
ncbi:MAG TPA: GIY-YIG nuclease family protein [Candidatus Absconditabacterales bacterium]|nr:GIY-YIG nuclease family protein [Candidatus Absconditabacterales bacterium]